MLPAAHSQPKFLESIHTQRSSTGNVILKIRPPRAGNSNKDDEGFRSQSHRSMILVLGDLGDRIDR
jgi:hypothetical protein